MGLAGRKEKQRFSIDPQNKTWKDDKDAIGFKLLSKMGWSEGKGLGLSFSFFLTEFLAAGKDLSGRKDNISLALKNNNYGIGEWAFCRFLSLFVSVSRPCYATYATHRSSHKSII